MIGRKVYLHRARTGSKGGAQAAPICQREVASVNSCGKACCTCASVAQWVQASEGHAIGSIHNWAPIVLLLSFFISPMFFSSVLACSDC